mmetsp:Transcript_31341/g.68668  ORF Transcript_31341/g.68668 Transcript_31341/m.68668 type:complete len:282 (+) Transcript_31341:146-991(+)|eukprot:CAMPEP_0204272486 /NCGR_PEP_ID=MMETSP0468-20130131/22113_1 /ASSEMBLY_ACC=CAM_ASM_000383 /TAXON_ID=2969 /ORGANISM="Oxyrrhis marina" /LENGTH=281 /DNA_ID=CAMNT_0051248335 /DNA_START=128 /DNA_END=973 /DNA_ORIENTATION=+
MNPGQKHKSMHFRYMFPSLFTFALFGLFLFPTMATLHLYNDPSVRYWIGGGILVVAILPFLFLGQYVYHSWRTKGEPSKLAIYLSLTLPIFLFFIVGLVLLFMSSHLADDLVYRDCTTVPRIKPLRLSYDDAREFHGCCLRAAGHAEATCRDPAVDLGPRNLGYLTIENCEGYEEKYQQTEHQKNWDYLQFLEENYACTGVCTPSFFPIWSTPSRVPGAKDACVSSIAGIMKGKVLNVAWQIMVYSLVVLFGFLLWLLIIQPWIQSRQTRQEAWKNAYGAA